MGTRYAYSSQHFSSQTAKPVDYFAPEQIGAIAGLAAAACWAVASVYYVRVPLGAGAMTTFKNSLAAVVMFVVLLATSRFKGTPVFQANASQWWDICISGVVGLCLADIAYFRSIQILGPRQGLTLTLLTPPAIALLGQWWLNDWLSAMDWLWIVVTLLGIAIVMRERAERTSVQDIRPGSLPWGVACALMGIGTMAVGAVILKRGTSGVDSVEATCIRLIAASGFGVILSTVFRQFREMLALLKNRTAMFNLCTATVIGTIVGVWLMLVAYKYCRTGIAATLTSTTPLFVIPVVWFTLRQRVTIVAIVGACVAFAGVTGLLVGQGN